MAAIMRLSDVDDKAWVVWVTVEIVSVPGFPPENPSIPLHEFAEVVKADVLASALSYSLKEHTSVPVRGHSVFL